MNPAAAHTWPEVLTALVQGRSLADAQARWAMREILEGLATPAQIAGFAVALRAKPESPIELGILVETMLEFARPITTDRRVVDVVGTGGDRSGSVNISTMAAIVTAGAGAPVLKHGNRSASSKAGTADVLEVLGIELQQEPDELVASVGEAGIAFCFAQAYHPALRHAGPVRRELGISTTFNFLGPLANPAQPQAMAFGCADAAMAPQLADVLAQREVDGWVFRGDDGLDELTTSTTSQIWRTVGGGKVERVELDPARLGIAPASLEDLRGGDAEFNARVVREVLAGRQGPVRDAVLLNAAAAVAAYDADQSDPHDAISERLATVAQAIDSGAAAAALERWVARSEALRVAH